MWVNLELIRCILVLSMVPLVERDFLSEEESIKMFPKDVVDEFGQQIDLRVDNSWVTPLEEVSVYSVFITSLTSVDFFVRVSRRSIH